MKYTEYGLQINLKELRQLLESAEHAAKYENMEYSLYIKGGNKPTITQYCVYADCNSYDYTSLVK